MSIPASGQSVQQRQRAVYTALRMTLGAADPRVRTLFELWQQEFSQQPQLVVSSFAGRAAQAGPLDDSTRSGLIRTLFSLLLKRSDELAAVPADWVNNPVAATAAPMAAPAVAAAPATTVATRPAAPTATSAAQQVFLSIAQSLLQPVIASVRGRERLLAEMFSAALRQSDPGRALSSWLREAASAGSMPALPPAARTADFKPAAHALYLLACDALGPVAADQALSRAIQAAQLLPAALEFAPDQLL